MKIISDQMHGALDYLTVIIFALAPNLIGLTGIAAVVSYALAIIHLSMTVATKMPLGVFKIIPIKLHAIVELIVGPVLVVGGLAAPTLSTESSNFFCRDGCRDLRGLVAIELWPTRRTSGRQAGVRRSLRDPMSRPLLEAYPAARRSKSNRPIRWPPSWRRSLLTTRSLMCSRSSPRRQMRDRRFSQNLPIFGIKSLFQISCRPCENSAARIPSIGSRAKNRGWLTLALPW